MSIHQNGKITHTFNNILLSTVLSTFISKAKSWICVLFPDCARCKLNTANIGYLASCIGDRIYYQCSKTRYGSFRLNRMSCPKCTVWSQIRLTCVRDPGQYRCQDSSQGGTGGSSPIVIGGECYTCIKNQSGQILLDMVWIWLGQYEV
jgi:hypothetical protein